MLSRNAPPTEEGVVYVPDWGEYDAGKTMRTAPGTQPIGKAPEKADMDGLESTSMPCGSHARPGVAGTLAPRPAYLGA